MKKSVYNPFVDGFQEIDVDKYVKMLKSQDMTDEEINKKLQIFTDEVNVKVNELIPTNTIEVQVTALEVKDGELQTPTVEVVEVKQPEVVEEPMEEIVEPGVEE